MGLHELSRRLDPADAGHGARDENEVWTHLRVFGGHIVACPERTDKQWVLSLRVPMAMGRPRSRCRWQQRRHPFDAEAPVEESRFETRGVDGVQEHRNEAMAVAHGHPDEAGTRVPGPARLDADRGRVVAKQRVKVAEVERGVVE